MDKIFALESMETFIVVSEDILSNLYKSKQTCNHLDQHTFETAKESIKNIITTNNFDVNSVAEVLKTKGWNEDKMKCFTLLIEKKKTEILTAALLNHNSKYGETITDFDWFVKLVVGTNDLKTLSYPLLQLVLSTINSDEDQKRYVYDINKDMLSKLINVLENIDKIE